MFSLLIRRRHKLINVSYCSCIALQSTVTHNKRFYAVDILNPENKRHTKFSSKKSWKVIFSPNVLSAKRYRGVSNTQKSTSKWLTIPNVLTGLRMVLSPYIGYLIINEQFAWAFGLVFIAAVTDSIDGWIARNYQGQSSILGSYIDPLADKIMISCLTLSLTAVNIIPVPLCGLIVLRDIMIATAAGHFHYKHIPPPKTLDRFLDFEKSAVKMEPTQISKYNTFLQLGLCALSVSAPIFNFVDHSLLQAYWYIVGTSTILSGLSYVFKDKSNYTVMK